MNENEVLNLKNTCANISDNIRALFPSLNLHFLICTPDKKKDQVATTLSKLNGHPAFQEAFQILKLWAAEDSKTSFLGLSEGQESIVFSFKTRPATLAFISVDVSLYNELFEAIQDIHVAIAIFFDTYSQHLKKPIATNSNIFAHKGNQLDTCRLLLKADIFSILQLLREGLYDAPQQLAHKRSIETLTPRPRKSNEEYAFPIALDVVQYTVEKQISSNITAKSKSPLLSQYQLAEELTSCFDNDNLQSWIQFANNSQMMAWRGFTPSEILGAAINTSTNPFIKAIGHMLAELTNLSPVEESHLPPGYNPFLAEEINHIRHERMVEETFEMIMYHVSEADSHLPLLRVANNQNEALLKGKISGWCAHALHAAAKAYLGAKDRGIPPAQAARLEFQSTVLQSNWNLLKNLGEYAITIRRQGGAFHMQDLMNWVAQQPDSKHLSSSLYVTISDPQYTNSLSANTEETAPIAVTPLKKIEPEKLKETLEQQKIKDYLNAPPITPAATPKQDTQSLMFEGDE